MQKRNVLMTDKLLALGAGLMGVLMLVSVLACGGGDDTTPPPPSSSFADCGGIRGLICENPAESCIFEQAQDCGRWDQMGTCQLSPDACTDHWDPICGCDGQTYSNECYAHAAGVSVLSQGECPRDEEPVQTCGGRTGNTCPAGMRCVPDDADQCGLDAGPGTCQEGPTMCPTVYAPVCGCDGQTYSSACVAAVNHVSVVHTGACRPTTKACGARLGNTCAADEVCVYEASAICGRADAPGTCQPRPEACTMQYDPVCGCDGQTYGNGCSALSAGVSVDHQGACGSGALN